MDNPEKPDNTSTEGSEVSDSPPNQPQKSYSDDLHLFSRFLVGLAILGSDELLERVRFFQEEIDATPELRGDIKDFTDENGVDTLRYLTIGTLFRTQRRIAKAIQNGIDRSFRTTNSMVNTVSAMSDNPVTRPFKRRVETIVTNLESEGRRVVQEGRVEELYGRALANETVGEIIDELIDYLAKNPRLAALIQDQLGEQSAGLAGAVVDSSRNVTIGADNLLEGIIRRLFRLTPRDELDKSPLTGKPQDMYFRDLEEWEQYEDGE